MKLATILLWAVALNAGHDDDWRRPPHHSPGGTPTPEPAAIVLVGLGLAAVVWKKRK